MVMMKSIFFFLFAFDCIPNSDRWSNTTLYWQVKRLQFAHEIFIEKSQSQRFVIVRLSDYIAQASIIGEGSKNVLKKLIQAITMDQHTVAYQLSQR